MASTSQLLTVLAVLLFTVTVEAQNKYVTAVETCYKTSKNNVEGCLIKFWKDIKPELAKGLPELNIPPLDPMTINNIHFNEQGTVVQIKATFSNVVVRGVLNHEITGIKIDIKSKTVIVNITMPALYITGLYDVDGTVLLLPVKGKGPFTLNLTDIIGAAAGTFKRVGRQVKIDTLQVEFKIGGITVNITGLLGEDTVADAFRTMLNENSQQILEDVRPQIQLQLAQAIHGTLDGGFLVLPQDIVNQIN